MQNNRCSVLLTTCDSYSDAWYPFFRLLEINWKDCHYPIYLNTETKDFSYPGYEVKVLHPDYLSNKGKPISWSARLKQALDKIDSEYILFMLEDFFIQSPVRSEVIEDCLDWMDADKKVGFIDFYHDRIENENVFCKEFSMKERNCDWAINANCALWRKQFLKELLRDEGPWDFEFYGTGRWRRTDYKIFTHREEFEPVIDYLFKTINGNWSGILKGKWLPLIPELFSSYGIDVNYDNLGVWDELPDLRAREREKHWFLHDIQKAVRSPRALGHYIKCSYDVGKDKIAHIKQKYFNK